MISVVLEIICEKFMQNFKLNPRERRENLKELEITY
jgi:hypothetical protein